ncbi:hypothetical protein [Tuberibacillus calidus]|nr:hypothetical protein [Tuberibacillus calidus]
MKQYYRMVHSHHVEIPHSAGHFRDEAMGQPIFHARESVSELKRRIQR